MRMTAMWVRMGACAVVAALLLAVAACAGSDPTPTPYSAAARDSAPRATPTPFLTEAATDAAAAPSAALTPVSIDPEPDDEGGGVFRSAPLAQSRIIVHTANIVLVVEDVARTVDGIASVAYDLGGWVVNSDRSSRHGGSIAVRVPAQSLDAAIARVEALALEVETRALTSEDVTDEYVDNESRLNGLRATQERLLSFLEKAEDVEDALLVQEQLSFLQQQIEAIQGRQNFLGQTAAFSLMEVSLKLSAQPVRVDAGGDVAARVGQPVRFRASFRAPEDIDEVTFTWDFGDGNSLASGGSIRRPDGSRVTSTVTHTYADDRDSPYIVTIYLTAVGEGGIGEGSNSIEVAVSRVPTIEVFAGEDRTVEEGDEVGYSASFTRHGQLWDYQYQWDFGDGSPTVTGMPEEGTTRVETTHAFSDHRAIAYEVVLTVSAMSDAGRVSGSHAVLVQVTESEGFLIWGWEVGETAKDAVRVLLAIVALATRGVIWLAILSPVALVFVVAVYLWKRFGPGLASSRYGRYWLWSNPPRPTPPPGHGRASEEPPAVPETPATTAEAPASASEGPPVMEEEPPRR